LERSQHPVCRSYCIENLTKVLKADSDIGLTFTLQTYIMAQHPFDQHSYLDPIQLNEREVVRTFMSRTFTWMALALAITAIVAYLFSANPRLMSYLIDARTGSTNILGKVAMFAPLVFVLTMSFAYNKLSTALLTLLFVLYAAVNGVTFAFILAQYTQSSVFGAFVGAAAMFGIMAVAGYSSKVDLTSFGRLMIMGLVGMVVVGLVNMFIGSDTISYIMGFVGVAVFTGLTAYDVQKLKNLAKGIDANGDTIALDNSRKLSIYGALSLYLDFINLFLSLLRVFGKRN
jgi:uncharacterized protein